MPPLLGPRHVGAGRPGVPASLANSCSGHGGGGAHALVLLLAAGCSLLQGLVGCGGRQGGWAPSCLIGRCWVPWATSGRGTPCRCWGLLPSVLLAPCGAGGCRWSRGGGDGWQATGAGRGEAGAHHCGRAAPGARRTPQRPARLLCR